MADSTAAVASKASESNRWMILFFSILSMVAVANFQYGWTLFVPPLQKHLKQEQALIQVAFTSFVFLETWLVPVEGWLVDKFGPRLLVMLGGVLAGLGWVGSGKSESLTALYLSYAVAGVGAGIVYGTAVGSALKWFPDHRGLAAGLTAAGYGAGSAATVIPIANMIQSNGYQSTFALFGIAQGVLVVVGALLLRTPRKDEVRAAPAPTVRQTRREYSPMQTIKTPVFWLMYAMMTLIGVGGLMATGVLASVAKDLGVDKSNVNLGFAAIAVVPFALSLDRILNGATRPFWGWVRDHIGRERTMTLAFALEACAILVLL